MEVIEYMKLSKHFNFYPDEGSAMFPQKTGNQMPRHKL
jgi:hypothetical protein